MSHAICVQHFDQATLENAVSAIEKAVAQAGLRRHSDYTSRVWLFCSPHFHTILHSIAQVAVAKTNCMNVWGGCVSGLLFGDKVIGHDPVILVAVFGKEFEPNNEQLNPYAVNVGFCIAENDSEANLSCTNSNTNTSSHPIANTLGLLSYGANYAKMPRIEQGRISNAVATPQQLQVYNPLILNSEGLTFLSEPCVVNQVNGLFLIQANGLNAIQALNAPTEQTRPVGLRLHVVHEQGESWIPVMDIHADGTLGLAAPVLKGQRVRLAKRTPKAIEHDLDHWFPLIKQHFGGQTPQLGVLFAGFERSQMCHEQDDDIAAVVNAFPNTQWIGLFGQAAWLEHNTEVIAPPRNNRLSLCLFNPNHV